MTEESRLDRIEAAIERNAAAIERNAANIDKLTADIKELRDESKDLGTRFGFYQQSTQALVNLAFSLVASATISVFVTAVLKR